MAQGIITNSRKQDPRNSVMYTHNNTSGSNDVVNNGRRITDNTNLNNQMSPGQYLTELRKQLSSTIDNMKRLGIDLNPNELTLDESLAKIDNYLGNKLRDGLVNKFGDCAWEIQIDNYFRPFLTKGPTKNDYRYILKKISWKNGPSSYQVFFYVLENFRYYLQSDIYDHKMFSRVIPNIEKRAKSYFFPQTINGRDFKPLEINISRIYHKINEKTTLQYYLIDVVDKILQIENIRHETKQGVFTKLQDVLEHIYYLPKYNEVHKQLMRYEVIPVITHSRAEDNTPITISNSRSKLASRMIKTSSSAKAPASSSKKEEEYVEGDGLSGTDQTDIHNDSIPPEEAEFDRNESGEPVGQESGEGNLPPPPPPPPGMFGPPPAEGPESPEEEAAEEAMEDPAEEANETPEQEAAEEAAEANEATEESSE